MSVSLETCIADNIAKFSQPKNPIYKMVYVYTKVDHDTEYFSSKKVIRLVELVENLEKCELETLEYEKRNDMSYHARVLHKMTQMSKQLYNKIKNGKIIVEGQSPKHWTDGKVQFIFVSMEKIA